MARQVERKEGKKEGRKEGRKEGWMDGWMDGSQPDACALDSKLITHHSSCSNLELFSSCLVMG